MHDFLAATAQQAPWWQTALISLIPSVGGALVALAGVGLNGHQTAKREERNAAAADTAQQIDREREVIADLIATVFSWTTAVQAHYTAVWFRLHPNSRQQLRTEVWEKANHDEERFTAALWKARVTVHNPAAREALRSLTDLHKEYSKFVEDLEDTHDHRAHESEERQLSQLDTRAENLCEALESAALAWDGTRIS